MPGGRMPKLIQAKQISDERMLRAIRRLSREIIIYRGRPIGPRGWALLGDVQDRVPEFPPKVVLAKLRTLKRRGLIDGCGCGCSGSFSIIGKPKNSMIAAIYGAEFARQMNI